jgi:hypothetical protein
MTPASARPAPEVTTIQFGTRDDPDRLDVQMVDPRYLEIWQIGERIDGIIIFPISHAAALILAIAAHLPDRGAGVAREILAGLGNS